MYVSLHLIYKKLNFQFFNSVCCLYLQFRNTTKSLNLNHSNRTPCLNVVLMIVEECSAHASLAQYNMIVMQI